MRWIIGMIAVLGLAGLAGGLAFLTADSTPDSVNLMGRVVNAQLFALGLIFLAIVLERAGAVLAFLHSRRIGRSVWSLALVSLCLISALNSLFFAMRLKAVLPVRWTLWQLPPEEVTPPLEALLLALATLAYAIWCGIGGGARRTSAHEQPEGSSAPSQASLSPPLPHLVT
jgi:hypothetical protein